MTRDTSSKRQGTGNRQQETRDTEQGYFALLSAASVTSNSCSGMHGVSIGVLRGLPTEKSS